MKRTPISKAAASIALAGTFGAIVFANWLRVREAREPETAIEAATQPARFELRPWGSGLPRAGQWRHGFVVIDFDGDGELDLVHGPARKAADRVPHIFTGDGAGHFTAQTRFTFPKLPYDYGDVAVADFDRDGALDLAVASHLTGVFVLVRRGDTFEPYASSTTSGLANFSSRAIEALDWNGDGRMDVIASSDGPRPFEALQGGVRSRRGIVVLLGIDGGFRPEFPVSDLAGYGDSLAIGDLDPAPGLEILAASNVVGSRHVLYRSTSAGLALFELPGMPVARVVRVVALAGKSVLIGGLAMGDHGLEGALDVVGPGAGEPSLRLFRGEPLRAISGLGTGDLDADGQLDVVAGDENGRLVRYEADSGGFTAVESIAPAKRLAGCTAYGIVLANLDRDAGDEVIVSYAGDDGACASAGGIEVYRLTKL